MQIVERDFNLFCEMYDFDTKLVTKVVKALPEAWLAGGAIRRVLNKDKVHNDFDFFFRSETHFKEWEGKISNFSKEKETEHYSQYRGYVEGIKESIVVQAIKFKYYSSEVEALDSFDYTISQFLLSNGKLYTTPEALWDLGRKRLCLHRVTYPIATMRRMIKYTDQGFTACSGTMKQILQKTMDSPEALLKLDITYVD